MLTGLMVILVILYAIVVAVLCYLAAHWSQDNSPEETSDLRLRQIRAEVRVEVERDFESRFRRAREEARAEAELEWDRRARKIRDDAKDEWEKRVRLAGEEIKVELTRERDRRIDEVRVEERARASQEWQSGVERLRNDIRADLGREWEERLRQIRAQIHAEADREARQRWQRTSNGSEKGMDMGKGAVLPSATMPPGRGGTQPPAAVRPASFIEDLSRQLRAQPRIVPGNPNGKAAKEAG